MNRLLLVFATGFALLGPALFAQQPPAPVETFTAPRVIDVVVTDIHGNRIHGLTAADLQILQDGKVQSITKFTELTRTPDVADSHPPRQILVGFDMSSLSMQGRRKSVDAIRALLKSRLRPVDRVMIAQVSTVGSAAPLGTWSSDPAEIEKQLATIERLGVSDRSTERKNFEQQIQQTIEFDKQSSGAGSMISFDTLMQAARNYGGAAQGEARRTIFAIQDLVGLLGEGPGKKIVLLAGGGLSTRPGSEIFEYLETIKMQAEMGQTGPGVAKGARAASPRSEGSRFQVSQEVRDLGQTIRNHGIVLYAIQPDTSGSTQLAVERTDVADTNADFAGVADQMSGYTALASMTGGIALMGGTPESAVSQIAGDFDSHYLLSFMQTIPGTGALPNVTVKSLKPGYRVRSAFTGGPVNKDSEVKDAVVAQHVAPAATNDLNIAVKNDAPVADGENRKVAVTVMIPFKSLKMTTAGDEVTGSFAVYICTGDASGHASTVNRQTKELRFPTTAIPQLIDKSIGFRVDVTLIPGRTQISVGVLDQNSEQTGFAKLTI